MKKSVLYIILISLLVIWKPLSAQEIPSSMYRLDFDSTFSPTIYPYFTTINIKKQKDKSYINRKLFNESFIAIEDEEFKMTINPLFDLSLGKSSLKNNTIYRNTRGINVAGTINNNFFFTSTFYETQLSAPTWIDRYGQRTRVMPGETSFKKFGNNAYDFGAIYGSCGYKTSLSNLEMNFRIGYDEFFIGQGYRSLLLSDFGFPYYFGAAQVQWGNLNFLHISACLQNPNFRKFLNSEIKTGSPYQKKAISFHYLTWNPIPQFTLGLFESTVFSVSPPETVHFSMAYLNPFILTNTFAYGLNGRHNVMLGMDAKLNILKHLTAYLQIVNEDGSLKGTSVHLSTKYVTPQFKILLEGNHIGETSYRFENMAQSYTHFNQYLAHPLIFDINTAVAQSIGSSLNEGVFITGYKYNRVEIEGKYISQYFSVKNIVDDNSPTEIANNSFYDITLKYVFNYTTRLQIFGNATYYKSHFNDNELFFRVGIQTQLHNTYWNM